MIEEEHQYQDNANANHLGDSNYKKFEFDFKQYSFAPLLLFTTDGYFDKGFSNFNSVEEFYRNILHERYQLSLLEGVIYDRKNMRYDELTEHCFKQKSTIVCCIEEHFTALQIISNETIIYYDPMSKQLQLVYGKDSCESFVVFHLMKCKYGDQQHLSENKDYYTGGNSNQLKRYIYMIWNNLMDITKDRLRGVKDKSINMDLQEYCFINNESDPSKMSTQATGNTCYFQTYLFVLLMKAGNPQCSKSSQTLQFQNKDLLKTIGLDLCEFTINFYFNQQEIRPYNNSNLVCDYKRYKQSQYYTLMSRFLQKNDSSIQIDYEGQLQNIKKFFEEIKVHQQFNQINTSEKMPSSINTKQLQLVTDTENAKEKLCLYNYYKYRPANMTFGFNTNIMRKIDGFNQFNSLRKNYLISQYENIKLVISKYSQKLFDNVTKYKDYYFIPLFEVGQKELIDLQYYTFLLDYVSTLNSKKVDYYQEINSIVSQVNSTLIDQFKFSTQKYNNYEKIMDQKEFMKNKEHLQAFLNFFMSLLYFRNYCALGFNEFNPKEKEINCLTQSIFYDTDLMRKQMYRMEFEFERECVNQMAKSTLTKYMSLIDHDQNQNSVYNTQIKIGFGITYSKYSNLLHFINVIDIYWSNPDINYIQIFGKDVRNVLGFVCQKIIFSNNHNHYHYGHMETDGGYYNKKDLLVSHQSDFVSPLISLQKRDNKTNLIISDRVFEYKFLKQILINLFESKKDLVIKTDDEVINLCVLSLMLDFELYEKYGQIINLETIYEKDNNQIHIIDKKKLQIQISNSINENDKKNKEAIQRHKIEDLINECSYKFLVNAHLNINSYWFKLINFMNSDQVYQSYIIKCKIYMSLCQINKSVELDYYKIRCEDSYKIIIPQNYSHSTSDYLDQLTHEYHFYEEDNYICHDNMKFFNITQTQPEINLYKIRIVSSKEKESMYRYIEISNAFLLDSNKYVVFVAGNILVFTQKGPSSFDITINNIPINYDMMFFNPCFSLVPCFRYQENINGNSDIALFTSPHFYYHVDSAGQFNENYYGMKHELIEQISIEKNFIDLNDQYQFKLYKLSELIIETKTVLYHPHYLLQSQSQEQLISLLDLSVKFRNILFFINIFLQLERTTINMDIRVKEKKTQKITGPWLKALQYCYSQVQNKEYDNLLKSQYFEINDLENLPLKDFVENICQNFIQYQKHLDDDSPQIVPTQKQKDFIQKIVTGQESFYFSEVGSGKSKVILPILCQMFLSNHKETHQYLSKNNDKYQKNTLFIIVPEHLLLDAKSQVFRYCLNLNYKKSYKIFDDVFNLLNDNVKISKDEKKIFISSFNQFKKALTYDVICDKLYPNRNNIQIIIDEVDDFLDRDKLVFNICQNKNNDFQRNILECYYQISLDVYQKNKTNQQNNSNNNDKIEEEEENQYVNYQNFPNKSYWIQLYQKLKEINKEVQLKSRSINKSFGIFNEETLKHCTNIAHDIEGYKCLIARPYESVNRAMSGSYYSDVERTIYLTYYILMEDTSKYNEFFQQERKNISFEFYMKFIYDFHLDYDELIYGRVSLEKLLSQYPQVKQPLVQFLFEIILRKMEIHDKSKSVNSVDVIFNFDCKGFTGTPFIDNYPTFRYIKEKSVDKIPGLINRDFYLYSSDENKDKVYKNKFIQFQGENNQVFVKYCNSDFMQNMDREEEILRSIFEKHASSNTSFNCIVDLCGIFKRINMHGIRNIIRKIFGTQKYKYIYYIDQVKCQDRILYVENENDIQYDDEFYKYLCNNYEDKAADQIFFYIDNRNVIGKDIPFQLIFKKKFNKPLIYRSVVLAHDVDDFSKIWQAMGRSRTMNLTQFYIYKNDLNLMQINEDLMDKFNNMQECTITKEFYIRNCDKKVIGNISSIYQTIIAIFNISNKKFYYNNEMVNVFILKMNGEINSLLAQHIKKILDLGFSSKEKKNMIQNIFIDKFNISNKLKNNQQINLEQGNSTQQIICDLIQQKFEQRQMQSNINDMIVQFLSGDLEKQMEVSYTKQQQKQKQNQMNKNQDSDVISPFSADKQILIQIKSENYFESTQIQQKEEDQIKKMLNLPIFIKEICTIEYKFNGINQTIKIFPTLQFLYSLYINPSYINQHVKSYINSALNNKLNPKKYFEDNILSNNKNKMEEEQQQNNQQNASDDDSDSDQHNQIFNSKKKQQNQYQYIKVESNYIKHNGQFSLLCIGQGLFILGMKNQFSKFELDSFCLKDKIAYICDESCHVLYSNEKCENILGQKHALEANSQRQQLNPYNLDLYIFLDAVTKHELANNVVQQYYQNYENLQQNLQLYNGEQGNGFICWRFIMRSYQMMSATLQKQQSQN